MPKFVLILILFIVSMYSSLKAADYPPQDHSGSDLILADGDRIWGEHTGIRQFEVPTSNTIQIKFYYPDEPGTGRLEIHAVEIKVYGVIDAIGVGFTGGGGWGGKKGEKKTCPECDWIFYEEADDGARGPSRYIPNDDPDGPVCDVTPGADGGYMELHGNGDSTTDTTIVMGSGGQGGEGGEPAPPGPQPWMKGSYGGGGGGGGGPGGGTVALYSNSILVTGMILTRGEVGENGYDGEGAYLAEVCPVYDILRPCLAFHESFGGDGGSSDGTLDKPREGLGGEAYLGPVAGDGGAGAGGGILLYSEIPDGILVSGTFDVRGGREQIQNGGSIKIFHRGKLDLYKGEYHTPRLFIRDLDKPDGYEVRTDGWMFR